MKQIAVVKSRWLIIKSIILHQRRYEKRFAMSFRQQLLLRIKNPIVKKSQAFLRLRRRIVNRLLNSWKKKCGKRQNRLTLKKQQSFVILYLNLKRKDEQPNESKRNRSARGKGA